MSALRLRPCVITIAQTVIAQMASTHARVTAAILFNQMAALAQVHVC